MELIFEVRDADEGGFRARALGHSIVTEAETWEKHVLDEASLISKENPFSPNSFSFITPPDGA